MQICINFKGDGIKLPIATGETIQGLIYHALKEDPCFSAKVHDEGNSFEGRKYKLMTFGELKGRYTIEGKTINYLQSAALELRSANDYVIQLLFTYFTKNKAVRLGNNDVVVDGLSLINKTVFAHRLTVRTLSPITAYVTEENGYTRYFSPEDEEFYSMTVSNARRKWKSLYGTEEGFDFKISPLEGTRFIKRATRFKDTFITAWHGSFVLEGSPETLNFLYNTGIGSKNSQGFGMFEVIE